MKKLSATTAGHHSALNASTTMDTTISHIDPRMKSRLAVTALTNALARRDEVAGCVAHRPQIAFAVAFVTLLASTMT